MNIAIVVPAFNESENLFKLIKLIKKYINAEIIIVDDSINDKTEKIIINKKINCYYFRRNQKLGRGSAVLYGFKKALELKNNDLFIEMDADLSHSPKELKRNIDYFIKNSLDLLISSRYLKGSIILNWPISRKIFSRISNLFARFLLNIPITDYTNGFRIYSKRAAKIIIKKSGKIGDGFIILSEILLIIYNQNFKIGEINSKFVNRVRGESTINIKLIIESFFGLIKLYLLKKKIN
jgi:dolichol-phosphate mannosyltransferase